MLRLVRSLRLREVVREKGGSRPPALPGLNTDLDEIFMEDEWWREVKQMKRSLVEEVDAVRCGGGGGRSESIDWFCFVIWTYWEWGSGLEVKAAAAFLVYEWWVGKEQCEDGGNKCG
ncbi:hypothetical protein L1987_55564 [Smallanthus sonchifolius]|uniref:Uncharacterized protein n=1 Tax=Smallanthus sonchifolius TaxID=185202 RepID=A0ACB9EB00_9ASTR|nr:hypothetical protein L1987_55564 [Smallanthus sonchifolius]